VITITVMIVMVMLFAGTNEVCGTVSGCCAKRWLPRFPCLLFCFREPGRSPGNLNQLEEFLRPYLKPVGERQNIVKADVDLGPLDPSGIIPVHMAQFCQLLLGELALFTERSDLLAE